MPDSKCPRHKLKHGGQANSKQTAKGTIGQTTGRILQKDIAKLTSPVSRGIVTSNGPDLLTIYAPV